MKARASKNFVAKPLPSPKAASVVYRRAPQGGLETYRGGQFVPAALWEAERRRAAAAVPEVLEGLNDDLQFLKKVYQQQIALGRFVTAHPDQVPALKAAGVEIIPLTTVEWRLKAAIRERYARMFLLGKRASGNLTGMTNEEAKTLQKLRRDEFKYLRNFLNDLREGTGRMDSGDRTHMYAFAAREAYALGFLLGNQEADRLVEWAMGPTEHCADCLEMAGVWKATALAAEVRRSGRLPQSGRLKCLGYHCQCELREAKPREGQKVRE